MSAVSAFDTVPAHARDLQRRAELKRWLWNYKGRHICLSRQADKVARFLDRLDRLKPVGDVVANVDTVHVGLPGAGVRAILEVRMGREGRYTVFCPPRISHNVALNDSNQRAVLVTWRSHREGVRCS